MICFTLTLTANQIACLRAIRDRVDRGNEGLYFEGVRNYVAGTRYLLNERLLTWTTPVNDKDDPLKVLKGGWGITEKGRLVMRLIELDVQDFAQEIAETSERLSKPLPEGVNLELSIKKKAEVTA